MDSSHNIDPSEVGVRELRDGLSRHLARVRDGASITVTDHGRAIARVVPLSGERTIDRMVAGGLVTPAATRRRPRPQPLPAAHPVSDLVAQQRR
ncbi:MAG: type II toxin-antitoxin system Phd/YefM family antitoxin [Nocardioidaceae bacterium]